jgi:putative ABC transport system permease protein
MNGIKQMLFRVAGLLRRRKIEDEMTEEFRCHLEMQSAANIASGMSSEDALDAARRDFGGIDQIKERYRDERILVSLDQILKEVRGILRSFWRAPKFTAPILTTLILGIGAATLIFELTGWITIRALPFLNPQQTVILGTRNKQNIYQAGLYPFQFEAYRQRTDLFEKFAGAKKSWINVLIDKEPVAATRVQILPDFFPILGIVPGLGRSFLPSEFEPGEDSEVVITDLFWRQHFNGSASALGKSILVEGRRCVIVGILKTNQLLLGVDGDIFQPLAFRNDPASPFEPFLRTVVQLKTGISRAQGLAALLLTPVSEPQISFFVGAKPEFTQAKDVYNSGGYWLILAAGILLYTVACLNAANLMLVRFSGRRREWNIRLAIGGSRRDVIRLVILESGLLVLMSAAAVGLFARGLFPVLVSFYGRNEEAAFATYWNLPTLLCIAVLSVLALVAMVLTPILGLYRQDIPRGIYEGSIPIGERPGTRRMRNALVVLQTCFAVILIVGAALMLQTFHKLQHVDLGFDPKGKAKIYLSFPRNGQIAVPEKRRQLLEAIKEKLMRIPGVNDASFGSEVLLMGGYYGSNEIRGADGTYLSVQMDYVSENFQKTAGLTMHRGNWVGDKPNGQVVINETLAKACFGQRDPIGQFLKLKGSSQDIPMEVIGVVKDVHESLRSSPGMHLYIPAAANPLGASTFVVRFNGKQDPSFGYIVRKTIYDLDPSVLPTVTPFSDVIGNMAFMERYASAVLNGLSSVALFMAAIGLFSALACTVDMRMSEFGVRMALGATPWNIAAMVMRRGLFLAGIGVVLGGLCAFGFTRFMRSILFATAPFEPSAYFAATLVLFLVALLTCWIPARRAADSDVAGLLRAE